MHGTNALSHVAIPRPQTMVHARLLSAQGSLRKSVGKALRKCLEGSPTPPRDTKKRSRMPEGGGVEPVGLQQNQHRHQHQLSSPREETTGSSVAGRQRKKRRAREGGGDTAEHHTKSDHEVWRDPPVRGLRTVWRQ